LYQVFQGVDFVFQFLFHFMMFGAMGQDKVSRVQDIFRSGVCGKGADLQVPVHGAGAIGPVSVDGCGPDSAFLGQIDLGLPGRLFPTPKGKIHGLHEGLSNTNSVKFSLGLFSFLSFWASYRFETRPLSTPKAAHATVDSIVRHPTLRQLAYRLVESAAVPFPTYFRGIRWLQNYAEIGAPAFLMGQHSTEGWWYYFLVAFAIKTPVPTLILLATVAVLTARDRLDVAKREYVLYIPVGVFTLATLFSFLNIGYRHILPVLPFLFVVASKVVLWTRTRWARAALLALCLWYAVSSMSMYPHYLAYFNEVVGGPENGYKYLVDSNLDWGQDLKNLKTYMRNNGLETVYLGYFGSAHVDYYDIQSLPLPTDKPDELEARPAEVYAISATYLQAGYLGDTTAFSWLREYDPFATIGYSILLYRLP